MADPDLELYKLAFRNTANPTIITNENYLITDVNQACLEFTGYDREDFIGKPPLMLFPDPDVYETLIEQLENDEPWQGYFETETKEGYLIYGRGSAIPLIIDGKKQGYSGIFVDLTERRQYEQALQVIHRVLRHDLRNEMNLIMGHLSTIESSLPEKGRERVEKVTEVAQRLVRRADKARDLERLIYQGFEQPKQRIRLDPVLEAEITRIRKRFPEAEIIADSIPECDVIANELLETVFESILENAVLHNDDDPRIEVTVNTTGGSADVAIADDGPGVPDAQKEEIFGREEEDELHHGEGFSLYFVDCITNLYRGSVGVSDNEWGGATFEISLKKA